MDEREPNSKRYWRMNELSGLWQTLEPEWLAFDEEHLELIRNRKTAYARLWEEEAAVIERYNRIKSISLNM